MVDCRAMSVVLVVLTALTVHARGEEGCSIPGAVFDLRTGLLAEVLELTTASDVSRSLCARCFYLGR